MTINTFTVLLAASVAFLAIATVAARRLEAKAFNGGVCPCCGNAFRLFDFDSQGGRRYTCDNCGNGTWCSYNVDKEFLK